MYYATSSSDHEVYVIVRVWQEGGVWRGPEIAPFSGEHMDMGPSFSPDGQTLYFTSRRPLPPRTTEDPSGDSAQAQKANRDREPAKGRKFDIWRVDRVGDSGHAWSEPVHLGSPVNTDANEIFPSVAADGTLYFQFYELRGGESDFYTSELVDGEYQQPVRLEYGISTEGYESHPAVAPDESYLLFQSTRPGGYGGVDFYVSFRNDDGTWSEPTNLGEAISEPGNVISPMLSPDGKYVFFARNGPAEAFSFRGSSFTDLLGRLRGPENGYGCLYWVDAEVVYEVHPRLRR
jgi:Tol biopolymer transport system component